MQHIRLWGTYEDRTDRQMREYHTNYTRSNHMTQKSEVIKHKGGHNKEHHKHEGCHLKISTANFKIDSEMKEWLNSATIEQA